MLYRAWLVQSFPVKTLMQVEQKDQIKSSNNSYFFSKTPSMSLFLNSIFSSKCSLSFFRFAMRFLSLHIAYEEKKKKKQEKADYTKIK